MTSWDMAVYELMQRVQDQTGYLHRFAAVFALWGGLALVAVLLVACWWFPARRRLDADRAVTVLVLTGVASVVALLVNQRLLSPYVGRPRPCRALSPSHVLLPCTDDYSMPSDHAVVAGALAFGLIVFSWRIGAFAAVLAVLLAIARVYVGVHYLSDVIVGLGIGGSISAMTIAIFVAPMSRLCGVIAQGPLRPLVRTVPATEPEAIPQPEPGTQLR